MNKRIKELAMSVQRDRHWNEEDIENFAELIIQECISALDKEVYIATREDGEQAFHDVILLEHFYGVE